MKARMLKLRIFLMVAGVHVLTAACLTGNLPLFGSALDPAPTPTPVPDVMWFGMRVPQTVWDVDEVTGNPYQHGLLIHRRIAGCEVIVMSADPVFAGGYEADWEASTHEKYATDTTWIDLWKIVDQEGNPRDVYYEVNDTTGRTGHELYRLGYFVVRAEENSNQCLEEVYGILITLRPDRFPDIGTAQG